MSVESPVDLDLDERFRRPRNGALGNGALETLK